MYRVSCSVCHVPSLMCTPAECASTYMFATSEIKILPTAAIVARTKHSSDRAARMSQ